MVHEWSDRAYAAGRPRPRAAVGGTVGGQRVQLRLRAVLSRHMPRRVPRWMSHVGRGVLSTVLAGLLGRAAWPGCSLGVVSGVWSVGCGQRGAPCVRSAVVVMVVSVGGGARRKGRRARAGGQGRGRGRDPGGDPRARGGGTPSGGTGTGVPAPAANADMSAMDGGAEGWWTSVVSVIGVVGPARRAGGVGECGGVRRRQTGDSGMPRQRE